MTRSKFYLFITLLCLFAGSVQAAIPGTIPRDPLDPNDLCNDSTSYWSTSMYCLSGMDFDGDTVEDSAPPPDPSIPAAAPADPLEDFWLHELPNWRNGKGDRITCIDGTSPVAWFSKARDAQGDLLESNKWIFYFKGGGSCSEGQACADKYFANKPEQGELTTAHLQVVGRSARYDGILSSSTQSPFVGYNRAVIHKCGYDRFNGYVVDTTASSTQMGSYDRRQMGYNITNAFLEQLRSGWNYDGWDTDLNSWGSISLPPLNDAELVLFFGTSGGAHGLYHNIDRFSDRLQGWSNFTGRVAAIFDSNFMPSLDGEDGDVYSGVRAGITGLIPWDDHIYQSGGKYNEIMHAWETVGDRSCRAAHIGDAYTCMDRHHVLANHIETDFLVLQDHWDPNKGHCKPALAGYEPDFADGLGLTHDCGTAFMPAVANTFGDMVDAQADDIAFSYGSSEIATGIDPSLQPSRFFVGLQCNRHEHLIAPVALATEIQHAIFGTYTLGDILTDWVDNFMGSGAWGVYNPLNGWSMVPFSGACP